MKRILFFVTYIFTFYLSHAQIPTGTWNTYFSYDEGTSLTNAGDKIYAVGSGSLFSYGLKDNAITTYSKVNGLNDVSIQLVRYYQSYDLLFIGYKNGNIDFIANDDIINVQDIKMATINGSKNINNVTFEDNMAYISSDMGIVVLNLDRFEVMETYILNNGSGQNPVNGVALLNGYLYAATDAGIYKCDVDNQNILNFSNWTYETLFPEYNKRYAELVTFNGKLTGIRADGASGSYTGYALINDTPKNFINGGVNFRNLQVFNNEMVSCSSYRVYVFNDALKLKEYIGKYNFEELTYDGQDVVASNDAIKVGEAAYFVADRNLGMVKIDKDSYTEILKPNGPASNAIWDMDINASVVRMVHGALDGSWNNTATRGEISVFNDNSWKILNKYTLPDIGNAIDFVNIKSDPLDPEHFYVASYAYGLFEFNGYEYVNRFDDTNSPILNRIPGSWFYRIYGLVFDLEGNLWLNNNGVFLPVHQIDKDGTWYSAHYDEIDGSGSDSKGSLGDMIVTSNGNKWLQVPRTDGGIFVFNENETPESYDDDNYKYLEVSSDNEGKEFANVIACLAEDKGGAVWIGTDNGIGVYYSAEDVFDEAEFYPARIKLPRENDEDDAADYLLDSETVIDIAIDGGNRKWIGTAASGVLLVSPDGLTTIHHFTTSNSPLPSNTVNTIEIDSETGEVFIATAEGLVSYGGDATKGNEAYDQIKVFPNPVRESFTGVVTISGLVDETIVKITDISGNLVYETTSNGGSVSWDRSNINGDFVGTGVYMVFCATKDGEQSGFTKLLVINSKP